MKFFPFHPIVWVVLGLGLTAPLPASPLHWQELIGTDGEISEGKSSFVAVEALPAVDGGQPARAFLAGNLEKEFQFGGLPLVYLEKKSGVVVRVSDQGDEDWGGDWQAMARADGDVFLYDIAVSPVTGMVHVCGFSEKAVELVDASGVVSATLTTEKDFPGFVAWLDPQTGAWLGSVRTDGVEPVSLTIRPDGSILVTGEGALAVSYSAAGLHQWTAPETEDFKEPAQIAAGSQPDDPFVYVLYEDDGSPTKEDVVVSQLDASNGGMLWSVRMGSLRSDTPGGLDVGPAGEVVVSYSVDDMFPLYDGQPLPGSFEDDTVHSFIARLQPDGSTDWVRRLGEAQAPGSADYASEAVFNDLAVDPDGTAWVCGWGYGPWTFGSEEEVSLFDDSLLLAVDATGKLVRHDRTTGEAEDIAHAVCAPAAGVVVMVGQYKKGSSYLPSNSGVYGGVFLPERDGDQGGYLGLLMPYLIETNPASQLRWREAIGTEGTILNGKSSFTAVEALPADQSGQPARAFVAGNVEHEFKFAGLPFVNMAKKSGVVARVSDQGEDEWEGDWQALARTDGDLFINDLAVSPVTGLVHVCGTSAKAAELVDPSGAVSHTLPTEGNFRGFVACLDPETGAWLGGFRTDALEPVSLAIRADGSIVVTGAGVLAEKYSATGQLLWSAPEPQDIQAWAHVATSEQPGDPFVYVLFRDKDSPTKEDVVVSQLDAATGSVLWSVRMGSQGDDFPGGLAVGPDGMVTVSYSAKHEAPTFGGAPVPVELADDATHAFIARLHPDSTSAWVRTLGEARHKDSKSFTQDIDIDPDGKAWVSGWAVGPWSFVDGEEVTLSGDTVLLVVEPDGQALDFTQGLAEATDTPHAVSAPGAGMVAVAGKFRDCGALTIYLPDTEVAVIAGVYGSSGTPSLGKSSFSAVEALPADEGGQPARSFLAGNIENEFKFDGLPFVDMATKSGVVIRVSDQGGDQWEGDWQALARTDGDLFINDLAISPLTGLVHVCGTSAKEAELIDPSDVVSHILPTENNYRGFVACLDPDTGAWLGGFRTDDVEPVSLAIRADGSIVVTGEGVLAAKYSATGQHLWTAPEPPDVQQWAHVATGEQPDDPFVYVLIEDKDSLTTEDVVLSQLDAADGSVVWTIRMGSRGNGLNPTADGFKDGDEFPGGLGVGPDGAVVVTYSAKQYVPTFDGIYLPMLNNGAATRAVIAKIMPDRSPVWVRFLGVAQHKDSKSLTEDLDVDSSGNAWVCGWADGPWSFSDGQVATLSDDALLLAVGPDGRVVNFSQGLGEAKDIPHAVSAPTSDLVAIAGEYRDGLSYLPFSGSILPARGGNIGGFFALLRPMLWQQLMVARPNPNHPSKDVRDFVEEMIELWGLSTYATVENGDLGTAVSIWMTDADIELFSEDEWMIIDPEVEFTSNGTVVDPGWALARVGDAQAAMTAPYEYPETDAPVVLYLIDTAVANPDGWFDANTNVVLEGSFLVRGFGDPIESTAFAHGTRMLSVIAGPESGAAQGTPIRVINYDVFPNGETTTGTLVAKGVVEAVQHHMQDSSGQPGVICLATSSEAGDTSLTLRAAIDLAVANGLTVIVSAGNHGGDVMQHIPASYGVDPGIVCVGASDQQNQQLAMSNSGPAVDLWAPGEAVRTLYFADPATGQHDYMTGTSPATALAAAAALIELSSDPALTPAGVEGALLLDHYPAAVALVQIGDDPVMTPFEEWAEQQGMLAGGGPADPTDDADGDGIQNFLEYFHGSAPAESNGSMITFGRNPVSGLMELAFPVAAELFDPNNPLVLLDGTNWEIELSTDMFTWTSAAGTLTWGDPVDGVVPVSFEPEQDYDTCFVRIKVVLP